MKSFAFLLIFSLLHAEEAFFKPKIYQSIWPDFCIEHLTKNPSMCSEYDTDENNNFYLKFLKRGSSNGYIDPEIIKNLANDIYLIPSNNQWCAFELCEKCNSPVLHGVGYVEEDDEDENASELYYR